MFPSLLPTNSVPRSPSASDRAPATFCPYTLMRKPGGRLISSSRGAASALAVKKAMTREKGVRAIFRLQNLAQPHEQLLRHRLAVCARELPELAVAATLHLRDEIRAAARHRRDDRYTAVQDAPHVHDEALGEALHLSDLVHQIKFDAGSRR